MDRKDLLPATLAGHWDTAGGRDMALRYAVETRHDLGYRDMSDFALANAQFMVDRFDLNLAAFQTAAKERIRWLSVHLALANQRVAELETLEAVSECTMWKGRAEAAEAKLEEKTRGPCTVGMQFGASCTEWAVLDADQEVAAICPTEADADWLCAAANHYERRNDEPEDPEAEKDKAIAEAREAPKHGPNCECTWMDSVCGAQGCMAEIPF